MEEKKKSKVGINILTFFISIPIIASIIAILFQGFAFAITGVWWLPAQQLFVGFVTSLTLFVGVYQLYKYIKLINNIPEDAGQDTRI